MGATGPTSVSIEPNPFTDKVTVTYSGAGFSGLSVDRGIFHQWRTSPDKSTWTSYTPWLYYFSASSSGTFTIDLTDVPFGHHVHIQLWAAGYSARNVYSTGQYWNLYLHHHRGCHNERRFELGRHRQRRADTQYLHHHGVVLTQRPQEILPILTIERFHCSSLFLCKTYTRRAWRGSYFRPLARL